ncbi:MAG TPA: hypothetical protein VHV75_19230 [Solirubrobacteraceae bacterium]|nr:hypothetical protein [Solirubrobacteraceae bacterium]
MINYAAGHPNDMGYQHMANLPEADLKCLGVAIGSTAPVAV